MEVISAYKENTTDYESTTACKKNSIYAVKNTPAHKENFTTHVENTTAYKNIRAYVVSTTAAEENITEDDENITVYLKINKNTIKSIILPTSSEGLGKTRVRDLKKKALSLLPGVKDTNRLRLIFNGKDLEDDQTLEHHGIQELSVIHVVMKMDGGGKGPIPPDQDCPRTLSMASLVFM